MKAKKYIIRARVNGNEHALYGRRCTLKHIDENGWYHVKVEGYKSVGFKFRVSELEEVI